MDYYIKHSGKKGMKWGYNDGAKNGKRTANGVIMAPDMSNNKIYLDTNNHEDYYDQVYDQYELEITRQFMAYVKEIKGHLKNNSEFFDKLDKFMNTPIKDLFKK